jgi:micrococcal nuclease
MRSSPHKWGDRRQHRRMRVGSVVAVGLVVGAVVLGHQLTKGPGATPALDPGPVASPPLPADAFAARIDRVIDGDTFLATTAGASAPVRVRVIGIDTPETVKPGVPVRCYGPQASTFTKHLLPAGTVVRADHEPGGDVDRYGRQLWDVWLPDGRFLESVLAAAGTARAYPYPPQTEHAALIGSLADAARAAHRGLWAPPCRGNSFS